MRIVLDTNVIFSAFAARGLAHSVFELCIDKHTIIISDHILDELNRAFQKKLKLPPNYTSQILHFLKEICILDGCLDIKDSVCRDYDDLKILGLAKKSMSDLIITGGDDLLILKEFQKIPIISPREFWQLQKRNKTK